MSANSRILSAPTKNGPPHLHYRLWYFPQKQMILWLWHSNYSCKTVTHFLNKQLLKHILHREFLLHIHSNEFFTAKLFCFILINFLNFFMFWPVKCCPPILLAGITRAIRAMGNPRNMIIILNSLIPVFYETPCTFHHFSPALCGIVLSTSICEIQFLLKIVFSFLEV